MKNWKILKRRELKNREKKQQRETEEMKKEGKY